jgi:hypothetical protein
MIWKIWKKSRLNSEKIWKIWKKSKLNSEEIGKYRRKESISTTITTATTKTKNLVK